MRRRTVLQGLTLLAASAGTAFAGERHTTRAQKGGAGMKFTIPQALRTEHEELHAELVALTKAPGQVGEAARAVAEVLHTHFEKEEEYALPPLGLLVSLAQRGPTPESKGVLELTERLRSEWPIMLAEHREVVRALEKLAAAASAEKRPDAARFAEKLKLHAETEEQVLYPAAILVGEYIKAHRGA